MLKRFDLDRALEVDPKFLEPEYPFEWSGLYDLEPGEYRLILQPGPDPAMNLNFRTAPAVSEQGMRDTVEPAVLVFSDEEVALEPGATIEPGEQLSQIALEGDSLEYKLVAPAAGAYSLSTEHHPDEFEAYLANSDGARIEPLFTREYKPDHQHDDEVTSVGISTPGDLDPKKFNRWLGELLQTSGPDIFRIKGILSISGAKERYVFQGIHMLFDGREDRPWRDGERSNHLIFIGRNLNREKLTAGFNSCLI